MLTETGLASARYSTTGLLQALQAGVTVLTANQRLTRMLKYAYAEWQQANGQTLWETPDLLPWQAWLQRLYDTVSLSLLGDGVGKDLLSTSQEQLLWLQIIKQAGVGGDMLPTPATARLAREAWRLQQGWQLTLGEDPTLQSEDVAAYIEWSRRFRQRCQDQGWLDQSSLPSYLSELIQTERLKPEPELLLLGFDEFSPQQLQLLSVVQAAPSRVAVIASDERTKQAVSVGLPSTKDEIWTAAYWARERLAENSSQRIAVVIPELEKIRNDVEIIFDQVLQPASLLPGEAGKSRPYNISLGRALLDYPLTAGIFLMLELAEGPVPLNSLEQLLQSPFIAGADKELNPRSLLSRRLRQLGELTVSLSTLIYFSDRAACPILHQRLTEFRQLLDTFPRRQTPQVWAHSISRLIRTLGWPGERTPNSDEYQTIEAWHELLSELATLGIVMPTMTQAECLGQLQRMTTEKIFQPKSDPVPVQIMGVLESSGQQFDQLWVLGLHDEAWPSVPHPNPFLPIHQQRQAGLPHASAERELIVSRAITDRLLAGAEYNVVSYPLQEADRPLRPSPLIGHLPAIDRETVLKKQAVNYWTRILHSRTLESLVDERAPPFEAATIHGGSSVFRNQAVCPFRAFAELRLGAQALGGIGVGLDPAQRGKLVHQALEGIWNEIASHQALIALDGNALDRLISKVVQDVTDFQRNQRPLTFTRRFTDLERSRLERLLKDWLEEEKKRSAFRVIGSERECTVTVNGLGVHIKIDRIDELEDGGQAVIDYKTGSVKPNQWFDERPDDPQLPLYSLALDGEPSAVLFGQLRVGEIGFKGVCERGEQFPGIEAFESTKAAGPFGSWTGLLTAWRERLARLADEFRAGDARVAPKKYPDSCRYCALPRLCRINEWTTLDDDSPSEKDDG